MRVIVMGCGRVGSALACALDSGGHDVVVIDKDAESFSRLPRTFRGRRVHGVGFDRRVLEDAGIEGCDAFAAVSSGDNSNIIAARVARESFAVDKVVARIYDAGRAEVYERLGIPTVATVPWATQRLLHYLGGERGPVVWRDPTGVVTVLALTAPALWVGTAIDAVADRINARAVALTRFGDCLIPQVGDLLQADDVLYLAVPSEAMDDIDSQLAEGPAHD